MESRDVVFVLGFTLVFFVVYLLGGVFGGEYSKRQMREEAIKNNAAHYELVGENGETKFVWGPKP